MKQSRITGIHHIAIKCQGLQEFQKTVSFYRDVLGLPVARTWGAEERSAIMLDTGNGLMEIFANATDTPSVGAVRHFAFTTEDPDALVRAVREAGYPITMEPNDICIPSDPPYPARIAFCIGPMGEEIEFFAPKQ